MLPEPVRAYVLNSADHMPATLSALLSHLPPDSPVWETRPDADRFSLREIVAHLADWDDVWKERFTRTVSENAPQLNRPDVNQRMKEKGYAQADPQESLAHLIQSRDALTAWLRALPADAWDRLAHLDRMGDLTLETQATLILAHDAYHLRQIAEWLAAD